MMVDGKVFLMKLFLIGFMVGKFSELREEYEVDGFGIR